MKKTIIVLAAAVSILSLNSCTKAYSCVCNAPPSIQKTVVSQYENVTKAQADKLCGDYVTTYATQGVVLTCTSE